MTKSHLQPYDIVQLKPDFPKFGGMLVVVDEIKPFGIQGYLLHYEDFYACRFKGKAYVRPKFEDFEYCGKLQWKDLNGEPE